MLGNSQTFRRSALPTSSLCPECFRHFLSLQKNLIPGEKSVPCFDKINGANTLLSIAATFMAQGERTFPGACTRMGT